MEPASPNECMPMLPPTTAKITAMKTGKRKKCKPKRIGLVHFEFPGPVSPDCPLLQKIIIRLTSNKRGERPTLCKMDAAMNIGLSVRELASTKVEPTMRTEMQK